MNIAAAMEESGLGAATPPGSNNWHGIKATGGVKTDTREQTKGGVWYTIKAGFHVFKTPADSFMYYAWLIANGAPYHAAFAAYMASAKTATDVENLTRAVAVKYATALAYAKALVGIEEWDKLFVYDQLPAPAADVAQPKETPPMAAPTAPAAPAVAPTPAPSTPFTFASLIAMVESGAALIPAAVQIGDTVYSDITSLIASPAAVAIEAWINANFTHVTTAGAAAIIEPKSKTPGKA
jgi:hypothetical protein